MVRPLKVEKVEIGVDEVAEVGLIFDSKFMPFHEKDYRVLMEPGYMPSFVEIENGDTIIMQVLKGYEYDALSILEYVRFVHEWGGGDGAEWYKVTSNEVKNVFDIFNDDVRRYLSSKFELTQFIIDENSSYRREYNRMSDSYNSLGLILSKIFISFEYLKHLNSAYTEFVLGREAQYLSGNVGAGRDAWLADKARYWNGISEKVRKECMRADREAKKARNDELDYLEGRGER